MAKSHKWSLGLLLLGIGTSAAYAAVIMATGFEGRAYSAGQLLDGQDEWVSVISPEAIYVSDTGAARGQKCVKILGDKLAHVSGSVWKATCGRFLNYDPVLQGTPIVHLRASAKLDGALGSGAHPDGMDAILYTATVAGESLGALDVSNDGRVWALAYDGLTPRGSVPYKMGTYVDLELRLDFNTFTTTYIVNGTEIASGPMRPGPLQSTELIALALQMDGIRNGLNPPDWGQYASYFDDYSVSVE